MSASPSTRWKTLPSDVHPRGSESVAWTADANSCPSNGNPCSISIRYVHTRWPWTGGGLPDTTTRCPDAACGGSTRGGCTCPLTMLGVLVGVVTGDGLAVEVDMAGDSSAVGGL